jgi:hypothetical protein
MKKVLLAACLVALPAFAADPPTKEPKAYTDPEKAGPDFKIQGEYVGTVNDQKVAAQVIADGDGAFTVRLLRGGLPGDGWDGKTQMKGKAKTANGKVTFEATMQDGPTIKGDIGDGTLVGVDNGGKKGELRRVVRHSPTEGAKPPAGATVLFDGKSADAWDHGKIENGLLSVLVPGGQTSKQKFGDFTAHVEFILPYMPKSKGQARGNSGVYLQGRYEVQVLDSFALKGANNECSGVYTIAAPSVNMCYPPLQWQTYDIDFTAAKFGSDGKKTANARLTLKHNGVTVHDNIEIGHVTGGNLIKESADPGPFHLQNHGGDPVYYRNIWVVEKK